MKVSRYFLLYDAVLPAVAINTATGGCFAFDAKALKALQAAQQDPNKVGPLRDFLLAERIIVADDVDEFRDIKERHRARRFSHDELYVTYALTYSCNFRCLYCYQEHQHESITDDAVGRTLKYVAKTLPDYERLKVHWFGGEPMLHMPIIEKTSRGLRAIASQLGKPYFAAITTNGSLFTETNAGRLREDCGVTQVQFTIDGPPDVHNRIRRRRSGRGTYEIVAQAIARATRHDFLTFVRINLSPANIDGVQLILRDLAARGLGPHNIRLYANEMKQHTASSPDGSLYFSSIRDYGLSLVKCLRAMSEFGYPLPSPRPLDVNCAFDKPSSVLFGTDGNLRHCTTGTDRSLAFLDAKGEICAQSERRHCLHSTQPWDDPTCADCTFLPTCMGGCSYLGEEGKVKCNPEGFVLEDLLRLFLDIKTSKGVSTNE